MRIEENARPHLLESRAWNALAFFLPAFTLLIEKVTVDEFVPSADKELSSNLMGAVILQFALCFVLAATAAFVAPGPRWRGVAKWYAVGYGVFLPHFALPLFVLWLIINGVNYSRAAEAANRERDAASKNEIDRQ